MSWESIIGVAILVIFIIVYSTNKKLFSTLFQYLGYGLVGVFFGFLLSFALDNFAHSAAMPMLDANNNLYYTGPWWAALWLNLPLWLSGSILLGVGGATGVLVGYFRKSPANILE